LELCSSLLSRARLLFSPSLSSPLRSKKALKARLGVFRYNNYENRENANQGELLKKEQAKGWLVPLRAIFF
jgi:hypothetical protein